MKRNTTIASMAALITVLVLAIGWWVSQQASAVVALDKTALLRAHSPSMGRADAPVVIVEFFDPACETCRDFYPVVKQLMAQYPDRIRLVMRYAPFHKGSDKVVAVLEAARQQGMFWPALEALLQSQADWASNHTAKVDLTWKHLGGVGLNMEQLAFDLTNPELGKTIAQDLADANTLGVSQTPEYFVNGRPLASFGLAQLQQLVAEEVANTR